MYVIYIYIHSVVKRMFHEGGSDDDEFPAGEAGYFRVFTGRPGLIRDSLKKNCDSYGFNGDLMELSL